MSNKNDLPSWLDSPDSGGSDDDNSSAALPPWLQANPPAPTPPPAAESPDAPADSDEDANLPPWLIGDEPPKSKTALIGGAELSDEYLSGGDRLVQHVESEITYDEWMAQKNEAERPKSIEEEIPDLLSDADKVAQTGKLGGTGNLPHTGSLPDWFLGLDALDERDVPDWFKDAQEIAPPSAPAAPGEVAPWMRDMVQPEPPPPVMPTLDDDEVASFFRGMGDSNADDPESEWYTETPDNEAALPGDDFYAQFTKPSQAEMGSTAILSDMDDDFYAQFGAKPPVAEPDADAWMLQPPPQSDLPDMGSFLDAVDSTSPMAAIYDDDDGEPPQEPEADYDAELPTIELNDDFFTAVAEHRERTTTETPAAVEDPDLSWFLNMPQTGVLHDDPVEDSEPAPTQIARPVDTGTLSWLSEIQGMVQSATHPSERDDDSQSDDDHPPAESWDSYEPVTSSGRAAEFTWNDEPEPEPDQHEPAPDWLNTVGDLSPETLVNAEEEPFEGTFFTAPPSPPTPPLAPRLTGMLSLGQTNQPEFDDEPEDDPELSALGADWADVPVTAADLDWQEIEEPGADAGWNAPPVAAADESGINEPDMSEFLRGLNLEPHDENSQPEDMFSLTNALRDWENPAASAPVADPENSFSLTDALRDWNTLGADEPAAQALASSVDAAAVDRASEYADVDIPDEELHSGWLTDDLFDDMEDTPRQEQALRAEQTPWADDEEEEEAPDFFALLETKPDHNLIRDPVTGMLREETLEEATTRMAGERAAKAAPQPVDQNATNRLAADDAPADDVPADAFAAVSQPDWMSEIEALQPEPSAQAQSQPDALIEMPEFQIDDEIAEPDVEMFADLFANSADARELALGLTDADQPEDEIAEPSDDMFGDLFSETSTGQAEVQVEDFDTMLADLLGATESESEGEPGGATHYETIAETGSGTEDEAEPDFSRFEPSEMDRYRVTSQEMEVLKLDDAAKDDLPDQLTPALLPLEDEELTGFDWADLPEDEPLPSSNEWTDAVGSANDALEEDTFAAHYTNPDLAKEWAEQLETDIVSDTGDELPASEDIFSMFEELEEKEPEFDLPPDSAWLLDDAEPIDQMLVPATSTTESGQPEDANYGFEDTSFEDNAFEDEEPDFSELFGKDEDSEPVSPIEFPDAAQFDNDTLFDDFDMATLDDGQDPFANAGEYGTDFDLEDLEFDAVKAFQSDDPSLIQTPAQYVGDIDDYLASLSASGDQLPADQPLMAATPDDLDSLFNEPIFREQAFVAPNPDNIDLAPADDLDWLGASVGTVSATAIARQIKDEKQPEELTERLKKLRQRAENLPADADAPPDDSLAKVLPGVSATLAPAPERTDETAAVSVLTLTPQQSTRVDLLKGMLALDIKPRKLSAIDLTYDSPFAPDLADSDESILHEKVEAAPVPVAQSRRRLQVPLERWLIAAILIFAVIAPFYVAGLRIGDLPPSVFPADSRQAFAFDRMSALQPGDLVLIGVEYGAAAAGELDLMTNSLIRHVLLLGGRPVIISGNPVALLRTSNLINAMNADDAFMRRIGFVQPLTAPLTANTDYFVVRFLPGNVLGLRAFSQDTAQMLVADIQGQATNLYVSSLADFAAIALVTDSADDVRAYAEQIAPLARQPLIAAISYSAAPLTEPYANSELSSRAPIDGLLVGYGDAYTYNAQLPGVNAVLRRFVPPIPTPRPTPTELPPTEVLVPAGEATGEVPGGLGAATPEATTPVDATVFAVVIADGSARLRSGPGTSFDIVDNVPTGTRVTVLGYNDAGDWVNVRLDDDQTGWISEPLLRIEAPQSLQKTNLAAKPNAQEGEGTPTPRTTSTRRATSTPRPTRTSAPTGEVTAEETLEAAITAEPTEFAPTPTAPATNSATAESTVESAASTEEAAPPAAFFIPPPTLDARDARWYAQTLGTIAIVGVITFGMIINLARAILRRGRSTP